MTIPRAIRVDRGRRIVPPPEGRNLPSPMCHIPLACASRAERPRSLDSRCAPWLTVPRERAVSSRHPTLVPSSALRWPWDLWVRILPSPMLLQCGSVKRGREAGRGGDADGADERARGRPGRLLAGHAPDGRVPLRGLDRGRLQRRRVRPAPWISANAAAAIFPGAIRDGRVDSRV